MATTYINTSNPSITTHDWYGKQEATITTSLAILLMVWHHLFGFNNYLSEGVSWQPLFSIAGISVERMIAAFGKICVSLFAFNSGYVVWKVSSHYKSPKLIAKRIFNFLLSYWLVLGIFLIFGFNIESTMPNANQLLYNLIGLGTGPLHSYINVPFAWYVAYYVSFLVLCPLLLFLFSGKKFTDIIIITIITILPLPLSLNFLAPISIGCFGILASKYKIFNKLSSFLQTFNSFTLIGILTLIPFARQGLLLLNLPIPYISNFADFAIVPLFICISVIFINRINSTGLQQIIDYIASVSMFVWYLHGIFFTANGILQPVVYWSEMPVIIYIETVIISIMFAIPIRSIYNRIKI